MKKKKSVKSKFKFLYFNRRLNYEYTVFNRLEVGVVLTGVEVRALLIREFDVTKSYIDFSCQKIPEMFWSNANINNIFQKRKILLHRKEISRWVLLKAQKKAIIIIQKIYLQHHRIKLEIVLAKQKKKFEKRQKISHKEHVKDMNKIKTNF